MYRIPLRLSSVDLEDDETLERIGEHLADLDWTEVGGRTIAVLYTDQTDPVGAAIEATRRIRHHLPTAVVHEVDLDLVGVSGIAAHMGVSREAVRLWVEGKRGPGNFPPPAASPSDGSRIMKLWRWGDVSDWLTRYYGHEEREKHLTIEQAAAVNSSICRVTEKLDDEWQAVSSFDNQLVQVHGSQTLRSHGASSTRASIEGWDMATQLIDRVQVAVVQLSASPTIRHPEEEIWLDSSND